MIQTGTRLNSTGSKKVIPRFSGATIASSNTSKRNCGSLDESLFHKALPRYQFYVNKNGVAFTERLGRDKGNVKNLLDQRFRFASRCFMGYSLM